MAENSKNIFAKLKRGVIYRSRQAEIVRDQITRSPYPYIFTADFNDVPNSYTYFTIRYDDLQDFLENFHTVDFQLGTVGSIGGVLLVRQ